MADDRRGSHRLGLSIGSVAIVVANAHVAEGYCRFARLRRAMRRFLLVLMMLIVSLQSTWAAVGELCAHESGSAARHLGHHEHRHGAAPADAPVAFSDDVGDVERMQVGDHADCPTCHGHGTPAAMAFAGLSSPLLGGEQGRGLYRRQLTDRTLDNPLRPPSLHLA